MTIDRPLKKETLAEQMAGALQDDILQGVYAPREALPTEPQLSEQFGVSRAVVRDAARLLMARGLVEVQHGRGMFVTEPKNNAFGDALLLTLQRMDATAWDVEEFELLLMPEVIAQAAQNATDEEIDWLRHMVADYAQFVHDYQNKWWGKESPAKEQARYMAEAVLIREAIFSTSHNQLIAQLARPLGRLRNLRNWADDPKMDKQDLIDFDVRYTEKIIAAIASRDPEHARTEMKKLMQLPPEAITAMQNTPVGQIAEIPIPIDLNWS